MVPGPFQTEAEASAVHVWEEPLTCPRSRSCSCCPLWTRGWPGGWCGWASPRPARSPCSSGWLPSAAGPPCPLQRNIALSGATEASATTLRRSKPPASAWLSSHVSCCDLSGRTMVLMRNHFNESKDESTRFLLRAPAYILFQDRPQNRCTEHFMGPMTARCPLGVCVCFEFIMKCWSTLGL